MNTPTPDLLAPARPTLGIDQALLSAFATPIANYLWTDVDGMNEALRELILHQEAAHPGSLGPSGWQSSPDFINRADPAVRDLRERLQRFAVELTQRFLASNAGRQKVAFSLSGSAAVMRSGHYTVPTSHAHSFWSGMYHVTGNPAVGGHPHSGKLELLDPRLGASLAAAQGTNLFGRFLLDPSPGQMVVFPAWLQHLIHPCFATTERVFVTFHVGMNVAA